MYRTGLVLFACGLLLACQESNTAKLIEDNEVLGSTPFDSINGLIKENPNDANLYFERSKLHFNNRELAPSLADIGRAMKLDSSNASFYMLYADLKLMNKESRASRDALLKAHRLDPNNIDVLIKLGELFMIVQDSDASFEYLNKALKLDVHSGPAYRIKGFNYKYMGDTGNAVTSFQTAIEQDPSDYDSYLQLGLIYSDISNDIALDYYNNALDIRPTSLEALYAKGLYLQVRGKSREALETYDLMLEISDSQFTAWYNKGYVYLTQIEAFDSAAICFSKSIETGPSNYHDALYNRGLSYEKLKDYKRAESDYRSSLNIDPQSDLAARGLERIMDLKQAK